MFSSSKKKKKQEVDDILMHELYASLHHYNDPDLEIRD